MQPLYSAAEFSAAKSCDKLALQCLHCKKTFFLGKGQIRAVESAKKRNGYRAHSEGKHQSRRLHDFCSNSCRSRHHNPEVIVQCEHCKKSFAKQTARINKTKHHFCCQSCAARWNNAHKTKGTRVSKLETWISKKLPILYPSLEFHFNRTDAINGELDIYIPQLRLAFELNGIFHYEPIYGPEKLKKMKTNDARKYQACIENDIELGIVDVSAIKYFKEKTSVPILKIICKIINQKWCRRRGLNPHDLTTGGV